MTNVIWYILLYHVVRVQMSLHSTNPFALALSHQGFFLFSIAGVRLSPLGAVGTIKRAEKTPMDQKHYSKCVKCTVYIYPSHWNCASKFIFPTLSFNKIKIHHQRGCCNLSKASSLVIVFHNNYLVLQAQVMLNSQFHFCTSSISEYSFGVHIC